MEHASRLFMGIVALIHTYILVLEMFLWERAIKVFNIPESLWDSEMVKTLLFNQGAYNGFLAAGLIFGLLHADKGIGRQFQIFFAACVFVAGIVGAATADIKIFFIQSVPALLAIVLTWLVMKRN